MLPHLPHVPPWPKVQYARPPSRVILPTVFLALAVFFGGLANPAVFFTVSAATGGDTCLPGLFGLARTDSTSVWRPVRRSPSNTRIRRVRRHRRPDDVR